MSDLTFRTEQKNEVEAAPKHENVEVHSISESKIEVPYLDYAREHGNPYTVDHFELGSHWNDRNNGFSEEIETIENYLQRQAVEGEIDNSLKGVKDRLKAIEKVTNMDKEHRSVVKIGILAEYVKFLERTQDIKKNITRYGNN